MMKRLRKIALITAGAVVLLVVLAVVVAKVVFTKERILSALTPRIEQRINRPVQIREAGISFAGGVGVWLGDITVGNRPGFSDEPFLTLHRFDLKARFWPLLLGRVELDYVQLVAPSVLLEYDRDGNSNLEDLMAPRTEDDSLPGTAAAQPSSGSSLTVDRIRILDGSLARRDARSGQYLYASGLAMDFRWILPTEGDRRSFRTSLALDSLELSGNGRTWSLGEDQPTVFCLGAWDSLSHAVHLDSLSIAWWGVALSAEGIIRYHPALTEVQLHTRLHPVVLQDVGARIAQSYKDLPLAGLEGTAAGELTASFVWPLPDGVVPDWSLDLVIEDVAWRLPEREETLTLPRLEIRGEGQTLSWSGPAGQVGSGSVSLSGTIDRLFTEEPMLSARVRGRLPFAALKEILASDATWSVAGDLSCDLTAFGTLSHWREARVAGDVSSDHLVASDTSWTFDSLAAAFSLHSDGESIEVRSCDWRAGESAGRVTGTLYGLVSLARSGAASTDVLRAELDLRSSRLNLDQLIGDPSVPDDTSVSDTTTALRRRFLATGSIRADTLVYSRVTFLDVQAPYEYKNSRLTLDRATGRAFGGPLKGAFEWDLNDWRHPAFVTRVRADSLDANGFLTRYFGWAGSVFGLVTFDAQFAGRGRVAAEIIPTLDASGRADMRSGRLETAPLLVSIGNAIGVSGLDQPRDLRDVAVPFRVVGGRIQTDQLQFASGGLRFEADGSFGLDRTLDYDVTLSAIEGGNAPPALRGVKLPFALTGTVSNPAVHINQSETAKSLLENLVPKVVDSSANVVKQAIDKILKPSKP